jgi:hypothetical protein
VSMRAQLAAAVTTELNIGSEAGNFAPYSFTAQRLHVPLFDLKDLKTLHVSVVGRSFEQEQIARSQYATELGVDVAVQYKFDGSGVIPTTDIDPLSDLVEAIIEFFRSRELASYAAARWISTSNGSLYLPEHLANKRLFTSVITLTYKVFTGA